MGINGRQNRYNIRTMHIKEMLDEIPGEDVW
jgi:hypothetical protein